MVDERMILDMLWKKYGTVRGLGDAPRFLVAEHPRSPLGDRKNSRVLDCLVMDRHCSYQKFEYGSGRPRVPVGPPMHFPVIGFEVKVSRGDWLRELRDLSKSEAWKMYCTHFYVVAPKDVVKPEELPTGWGLIIAGPTGLRTKIKSPYTPALDMPAPIVAGISYATMVTARRNHA